MRRSGFNCSKSQVRGKIIFRKRKKERKETEWTHSAWANNSAYRDVSPVFIFCLEVVFFCFFLPAVPRARSIEIITDTYINLRRIYMQTVFFFFSLAPLCIFIFFPGDFFLLFYPLICLWSVYRRVEGAKWCAMPTLRSDTFFRDPIPRNVKRK